MEGNSVTEDDVVTKGRSLPRPWSLVLIVAAGLAAPLTWLLLIPANLSVVNNHMHADRSTRTFTQDYVIKNDGAMAERVVRADVTVPGIAVVSTNVGSGIWIASGKTADVLMRFHVTDCKVAPFDPIPVHLRLHRWWGVRTVTVQDYGTDFADAWTACGRTAG